MQLRNKMMRNCKKIFFDSLYEVDESNKPHNISCYWHWGCDIDLQLQSSSPDNDTKTLTGLKPGHSDVSNIRCERGTWNRLPCTVLIGDQKHMYVLHKLFYRKKMIHKWIAGSCLRVSW